MLRVIRTTEEVDVDESDVISLKDASGLSGRKMPSIGNLLDRGVLPWFEMPMPTALRSKRTPRYTSRKAVLALPKEKKRGVTARKRG